MKQFLKVIQLILLFSPLLLSQDKWYFQWESITRECLVYLPKSRVDQAGLPVVFNLHAYDWTAAYTRDYLKTHLFGDSVGFITVYPSASDLTHWNSGISENPQYPTPNTDDVGFISMIIDSLISRFNIDTQRIYSCGYSNGGFMSLKLAGRLGNRITSIASVCGVITAGTVAAYNSPKPIPAMLIHGTNDQEVYYNGGQTGWYSVNQTIDLLINKNLCQSSPETLYVPNIDIHDQSTIEKYTYRSSANTSQVILFKVIGGRHVWPDAPPIGTVPINRDINATKEIWNFFKQFPIPNPRFTASSHDAKLDRSYYRPDLDSIFLNVILSNPLKHTTKLSALIHDVSGVRYDSISLYNDGLHGDGNPDDSVWGCRLLAPKKESSFTVKIRTDDIIDGSFHLLPQLKNFFTNGPVKCKNVVFTTTDTIPNPGDSFRLRFRLGNIGTVDTVKNVEAMVTKIDTMISLGTTATIFFGNLPPGKDSLGIFRQEVKVNPACPSPKIVKLLLTIFSEGIPVWTDTVSFTIQPTGIFISDNMLPTEFSLEQNFPNPFNPATTIRYALPSSAHVKLTLHDILGREIATLVNEEQTAGWKEVEWNASSVSSGIYFYKLSVGSFVETKKMMMVK